MSPIMMIAIVCLASWPGVTPFAIFKLKVLGEGTSSRISALVVYPSLLLVAEILRT
jgi:hypothetical protein